MTLKYLNWSSGLTLVFIWACTVGCARQTLAAWNHHGTSAGMYFPFIMAVVMSVASIWLTCFCLFNRVVVDESEIRGYNSFNQLKFQAPRGSISIEAAPSVRDRYRLTSGADHFYLYSSIDPLDRLGLTKPTTVPDLGVPRPPTLVSGETTFNCRTPLLYFVAALMTCIAALIPVISHKWIGAIFPAMILPMFALKIANERLIIGPYGIRYYDMMGKLKTTATLDEIQGVQATDRSSKAYIRTQNGPIPISGFPQTDQIKEAVAKIVGKVD